MYCSTPLGSRGNPHRDWPSRPTIPQIKTPRSHLLLRPLNSSQRLTFAATNPGRHGALQPFIRSILWFFCTQHMDCSLFRTEHTVKPLVVPILFIVAVLLSLISYPRYFGRIGESHRLYLEAGTPVGKNTGSGHVVQILGKKIEVSKLELEEGILRASVTVEHPQRQFSSSTPSPHPNRRLA